MRSLAQATAAAALLWSDSTCATVQRDSSPPPPTMRAVKKAGAAACGPPDFSCLDVVDGLPTPVPLSGEVLVRITSSSFNPDDVSNLLIEGATPIVGFDVAGVVEQVGFETDRLKVGDRVWGFSDLGGLAEYVAHPSAILGLLPPAPATDAEEDPINMSTIGSVPTVALTMIGAFRRAGAPWAPDSNTTVLITAGTGGTGYMGVQLAKVLGAAHVITAATGDGIALAKSLGAEAVADYKVESVFDLPGYDTTVDVVLENHFDNTTAPRAMEKLSANPNGGAYVSLDYLLVDKTPPNVTQEFFDLCEYQAEKFWVSDLDFLAECIVNGSLRVIVDRTYNFDNAVQGYVDLKQGHTSTKLAFVPTSKTGTRPKKSTSIASAAPTSATMRAIRKNTSSPCGQHDLSCLAVVDDAPRPYALSCEVLIRTTSSSYNPDDAVNFNLAGTKFVPGFDVAGVVEDLGPITPAGFQKGDRVWGMFLNGGQAEYVARPPFTVGLLPPAPGGDGADPINMSMVGTLPTVGLTMMGALRQAGAPWKQQDNITLILTAGNGGTGYVGVQLAKALGASYVATAATGDGIAFAKSLGADAVADYMNESVFDLPGFQSAVDVVIENHYDETTPSRAMKTLSANPSGGVYVSLDGLLANDPPANVQQVFFDLFEFEAATHYVDDLDTMAKLLVDGRLRLFVDRTYTFADALQGYEDIAKGRVLSKFAFVPK